VNKGIMQFGGKMENSQVVFGKEIIVNQKMQKDIKVNKKENQDIEDDLEAIKKQLEDLNLMLSEHKSSLDELGKKALILETEIKKENPNKEDITKSKKDLLTVINQVTGTINNFHNILGIFTPFLKG
jgi:chromosome segregation ATPase